MKQFKYTTNIWNSRISTLSFVLCFVGYPFITSLFSSIITDVEGSSRIVTIPFRAFCFFIVILVFILNRDVRVRINSTGAKLLILYWFLLLTRIYYDLELRTDVYIREYEKIQAWLYAVPISFLTTISILKSYKYIDVNKSIMFMWLLLICTLIFNIISNPLLLSKSDMIDSRMDGNLALNTISFGHVATSSLILSCYIFFHYKRSLSFKIILLINILLAGIIMIRAGSRGPLVCFIVLVGVYFFVKGRNIATGLISLIFLGSATFLLRVKLEELIAKISPVMSNRILSTLEEGDTGGRDTIYKEGINNFLDNPIIGKGFAMFHSDGYIGYTHNLFLDAFSGLGFVAGIIMVLFICKGVVQGYNLMKSDYKNIGVVLIIFQYILLSMTSGAFYSTPQISVGLMFIFMYSNKNKDPNQSILISKY